MTGAAATPGAEDPRPDAGGSPELGPREPGTQEPGTHEPGTQEPGTQEPGTPEADGAGRRGYRRPRNLLMIALAIGGLWPSFWFAGIMLIPMSFWATWPGRWMPRHWLMTVTGALWAAVLPVRLSAPDQRVEVGLEAWQPPEWMVALSTSAPLVVMGLQAAAIGAFAWALWSDADWLNGPDPQD